MPRRQRSFAKPRQEWAEVDFVPSAWCDSKRPEVLRYLAVRERKSGEAEKQAGLQRALLPCMPAAATLEQRDKLTAVVTNRTLPGDEVIVWHRGRCGKDEEINDVMKRDLGGGTLPSGLFGANAAWWAVTVLAFNINEDTDAASGDLPTGGCRHD